MRRVFAILTLVLLFGTGSAQTLNESFTGTQFPPPGWVRYNADGGQFTWIRYTNRYHTAPACAGINTEKAKNNNDWLVSRAVVPAGADTMLKFFYNGQDMGHTESLEIWISTTNQQLSSFTTRAHALSLRSNKYESLSVSLGAHKNQALYLGFRYLATSKSNQLFIDGISGLVLPAKDVGAHSIRYPRLYEPNGAVVTPRVRITNYGTDTQSGFPVSISIIDTLTNTLVFTDTAIAGTVQPGQIVEVAFTKTWTAALGEYWAVATTHLNGDVLPGNDSYTRIVHVLNPPFHDVGVTDVIRPYSGQYAGPIIPRVEVTNFGSEEDTFPVVIQILSEGTPVFTSTIPQTILAPYSSGTFDFPNTWNATAGEYKVVSWTALSTDLDVNNDTFTTYISISPPVHDVAAISFLAPPETVYTATSYTPQAVVENTGSYTETFNVTRKIGTYTSTVSVGPLNPGQQVTATFAPWTPPSPGTLTDSCYTQLSTDADRSNDTIYRTLTVVVGPPTVTVTSPNGGEVWQVGSSQTITWTHGGGTPDGDSIWYRTSDTGPWIFIAAVGPGTTSYLWNPVPNTPSESCKVLVKAFNATGTYSDQSDDYFTIAYQDVGATMILQPAAQVDSGWVITPKAVVYNYGSRSETFPVTFRIGSVYDQTVTGITLTPGQTDTVDFPNWVAQPIGTHQTMAFTDLTGDQNRANDTVTSEVQVLYPERHDVGATMILAPVGRIDEGTVVTPRAVVYNYGTRDEPEFPVTLTIGSDYRRTLIASLAVGASDTLSFEQWTAGPAGVQPVVCFTEMAGDINRTNDTARSSVTVEHVFDVGTEAVLAPVGVIRLEEGILETTVSPRARIANFGQRAVGSFTVRFWIDSVDVHNDSAVLGTAYEQVVTVSELAPGARLELKFPDWALPLGNYVVSCSTMLAEDRNHDNDRSTQPCNIAAHAASNRSGRFEAVIYTRAGERIRSISLDIRIGDPMLVRWDGLNDRGNMCAPGIYLCLLRFVPTNGATEHQSQKLLVTSDFTGMVLTWR